MTPEQELALAAAAQLFRRERKTARSLLRSERQALVGYRRAVGIATNAVVASSAVGGNAIAQVRRQLPGLQSNLRDETLRAQQEARSAGRARLAEDFGSLPSLPETLVADEAFAALAGSALSTAWATAALTIASGEQVSASVLAELTRLVEPRFVRTASTEVARAFNHERNGILIDLGGGIGDVDVPGVGGPLGPKPPEPGLFKVWSAILDRVTCPACFKADGEIVEARASFSAGVMPLHPHCRCVVEYVIVPKPERLEDIAIDYELFKQELRDIIRERREIGDRHALSFVSDSLGENRSPKALTKRFYDESYAIRRSTVGDTGGGGGGAPPRGNGGGGGGPRGPRSVLDPPAIPQGRTPPPWHVDDLPRPPGRDYEASPTEPKFRYPHERRIGEKLRAEGNDLWVLRTGPTPTADVTLKLAPPGEPTSRVDFKSATSKRARVSTKNLAKSVRDSAESGQARNVILDLRDTPARDHHARMIANELRTGAPLAAHLDYVRIVGDTFDITFHGF